VNKNYVCPFYLCSVQAGFPSPAEDYVEKQLDINEYLIANSSTTFFVRAYGDSMRDAGIHDGSILVVDRAREAVGRNIVIAVINGELTVKRVCLQDGSLHLVPENSKYKKIKITLQ
jgi:DNA polymerase V